MNGFILEPTIGATLLARSKASPERTAFRIWKSDQNRFETMTFGQLHYESHYVSTGLSELGILPGDRVALQSSARAEWLIADLAIMGAKAVSVPISPSASRDELLFILRHSQATGIFVENEALLRTLLELKSAGNETLGTIKAIILIESPSQRPADQSGDSAVTTLPALREFGVERGSSARDQFEMNLQELKPDDLVSITYTSGTTGNPKGVMINHRNLFSVLKDSGETIGRFIDPEKDEIFSLIDSANALSRVELYGTLAFGWKRIFSDQSFSASISLPQLQPSVLFSTTAYFERLYRDAALKEAEAAKGNFSTLMKKLRENPFTHLVLQNPILAKTGNSLRLVICAGTGVPEQVIDFFASAGVTLLTGYGSTETSGTIALNTPDEFKVGSSGRPLPEVSVRTSPEGELLIKSEKVFCGYYRMEEETRAALKGGWFHTGDSGYLDSEGFLFITDRKKDFLVLKSGKKFSPLRIERLAKLNPYFQDFFVFGEGRDYLTALVTLDRANILKFAEKKSILFTQYEDLVRNPGIIYLAQKGVEDINAQLGTDESVRKFVIISQAFGEGTGEVTRSRHLRRSTIELNFKAELESLYLDSPDPIR